VTGGREGNTGPAEYAGLPVAAFLDALAARAPAPAGGSAAALVLAQAAALCAKSARLSERQLSAGRAARLTGEAEQVLVSAASLIDEDPRAYADVLRARRRAGQAEGSADAAAGLAAALSAAADVPLRIVELSVPVSAIAAMLAAEGNPGLRGDALAAGLLARAAAEAAAGLVRINLAGAPGDARHARADQLLASIHDHLT